MLAMAELLASFSRWTCPNERTSCSIIAASARQVLHRLLMRTQRIGKKRVMAKMARNGASFTIAWRARRETALASGNRSANLLRRSDTKRLELFGRRRRRVAQALTASISIRSNRSLPSSNTFCAMHSPASPKKVGESRNNSSTFSPQTNAQNLGYEANEASQTVTGCTASAA